MTCNICGSSEHAATTAGCGGTPTIAIHTTGPHVRADPNATASPPSMPSSLEAGE